MVSQSDVQETDIMEQEDMPEAVVPFAVAGMGTGTGTGRVLARAVGAVCILMARVDDCAW